MLITATELKANFGKYLALAASQEIIITKNGKSIAKLTSASADRIAALDGLVGIVANTAPSDDDIKKERLGRQ